ncbi:MAG: RES domain-containing protein [Myxococcota bacterium]
MTTDEECEVDFVCWQCVGEDYLQETILASAREGECSFCGVTAPCMAISELADRIERVFRDYYDRTPRDAPDDIIWDLFEGWDRPGEHVLDVIQEVAEVSDLVAARVLGILTDRHDDIDAARIGEECEFGEDSYYQRRRASDGGWSAKWRDFEESLKKENRFFNDQALDMLRSVFGALDELLTGDGASPIVTAGPHGAVSRIFRARFFESESDLRKALMRPDLLLGPPPSEIARAGRMNASGISTFYGATSPEVALAETRPPVGTWCAVAQFDIIRPLQLLDLAALASVQVHGSVFDPAHIDQVERAEFLRSLSARLSRVVAPSDETLNYLPTQVIADYLSDKCDPTLDGIIFSSVQYSGPGANVALFYKASRVEKLEYPEGAEFRAYRASGNPDDPMEPEYLVDVTWPKGAKIKREAEERSHWDWSRPKALTPSDSRSASLRVDAASIAVHRVLGVHIQSECISVRREEYEVVGSDDF